MKSYKLRLMTLSLVSICSFTTAYAETAVTVNGTPISSEMIDLLVNQQVAQGAKDDEKLREDTRQELIKREIIMQEALKKKLEQNAETKSQLELARQSVLIRAYLQDFVANYKVSDKDIEVEYKKAISNIGSKEYKPRHILLATEEEAKDAIKKLQKGADFTELAKTSQDPGSREQGGELGWSSPAMFVKPFSDAMIKLNKGEYTKTPVKSDFGYHVIKLDDVRDQPPPTLEQLKPQIEQFLQQQALEKEINSLEEKATIK